MFNSKVFAFVTASVLLLFNPIVSSADSIIDTQTWGLLAANNYDVCDVNHDGQVNVADINIVNNYLSGKLYVEKYNMLDVNKNFTVDHSDSQRIMDKIMSRNNVSISYYSKKTGKNVPLLHSTSFIGDADYKTFTPRAFLKHKISADPKEPGTKYVLTPSKLNSTVKSNNSLKSIVDGKDTRYISCGDENEGIVNLEYTNSKGRRTGSGFIVGNHQIATAAHCVYDISGKRWASNMKISTFDADSNITLTNLHVVELHIPKAYISNDSAVNDYALITVEEDLSNCFQFDLASTYNITNSVFSNIPIYATGMPTKVDINNFDPNNFEKNDSRYLYSDEGHIIKNNKNSNKALYTDLYISGGQSGGPIYLISREIVNGKERKYYTAISLISEHYKYDYSSGTLFTKYHLQFYLNNTQMKY